MRADVAVLPMLTYNAPGMPACLIIASAELEVSKKFSVETPEPFCILFREGILYIARQSFEADKICKRLSAYATTIVHGKFLHISTSFFNTRIFPEGYKYLPFA